MASSEQIIATTERYGAKNYDPLPIVITKGEGVWVEDPEGNRYLDMLSAYSALNHGHRHPHLIQALLQQAEKVTLTSRAFYSETLASFYERLASYTGKAMILPMNTGAEAVETALKVARRWAYQQKQVPANQADIIVCNGNFHGRTITVTSFSAVGGYKQDFGPFTPGFSLIPFGDVEALEQAITPNTAAFLIEPIQGENGITIPPDNYLRQTFEICKRNNVLFLADEIQTGFGRTGKRFACDWEKVVPDIYIMGKALGGGVLPISAIAADEEVLGVLKPGSHGSTFGGNPLACAVAIAALDVLEQEQLTERSRQLGIYFKQRLDSIHSPLIRNVRGRGLFIGVELVEPARPYCELLMQLGMLCKETCQNVIRLAPPLMIEQTELDWALERIERVLTRT